MSRLRGWVLGAAALSLVSGCGAGPRQFARVDVETNPPSAEVYIGEAAESHDSTPCTLLFEQPGEFELFFKKPGYLPLKKRVTVVERKADDGQERLEALPTEMVLTLDPLEGEGEVEPPPPPRPYYDD